jgi:hypothetical protein
MNFMKVLKNRIEKEGSKSAAEIYREEQSKLIDKIGDMEVIARSLPEVASGLYKHKAKFVPAVP